MIALNAEFVKKSVRLEISDLMIPGVLTSTTTVSSVWPVSSFVLKDQSTIKTEPKIGEDTRTLISNIRI